MKGPDMPSWSTDHSGRFLQPSLTRSSVGRSPGEYHEGWLQEVHPEDRDHLITTVKRQSGIKLPFFCSYRLRHNQRYVRVVARAHVWTVNEQWHGHLAVVKVAQPTKAEAKGHVVAFRSRAVIPTQRVQYDDPVAAVP
jgi:hypothetical protein